jgi:hypothetical protein
VAKPSKAAAATLVFKGEPRRLVLSDPALAEHETGEVALPEDHAGYSPSPIVPLRLRQRRNRPPYARFRLASTAPPGRHRAELRLSETAQAVEIDIEPAPRLAMDPSGIEFVGAPGEDASAEVRLLNEGNVAIDLAESATAPLFNAGGIKDALVETCRGDSDDPLQLFGMWMRSLRARCGVIEIRLAGGAASLSPGEARTVNLTARLPAKLVPGLSYYGLARLGPNLYLVAATARDGAKVKVAR